MNLSSISRFLGRQTRNAQDFEDPAFSTYRAVELQNLESGIGNGIQGITGVQGIRSPNFQNKEVDENEKKKSIAKRNKLKFIARRK